MPPTPEPEPEPHLPPPPPPLPPSTSSLEGWSVSSFLGLEAWNPTPAWVAVCENSDSEPHQLTWLSQGAEPRTLDALLQVSPSGRYLIILQAGQAWLLDAQLNQTYPLADYQPDLASDGEPEHRSFAFSQDEQELALLSTDQKLRILALPRLASESPAEPRIFELPEPTWRVQTEGDFFALFSYPAHKSGWPLPSQAAPPRRCEATSFPAHSTLSDPHFSFRRRTHLLSRAATRLDEAPGFVFALGSAWVRRQADGRLLLVRDRTQKQLAASSCGARILHSQLTPEQFLIACEQYRPTPTPRASKKKGRPQYRFPLYLASTQRNLDLKRELLRTGVDLPPRASTQARFFPLRVGGEVLLLDQTEQEWISLARDTQILTVEGESALIRTPRGLFHWTLGAEPAPLSAPWVPLTPFWARGPWLAQTGWLLHWPSGILTELPAERVLDLHADGSLLVLRSHSTGSHQVQILPPPELPSGSLAP